MTKISLLHPQKKEEGMIVQPNIKSSFTKLVCICVPEELQDQNRGK